MKDIEKVSLTKSVEMTNLNDSDTDSDNDDFDAEENGEFGEYDIEDENPSSRKWLFVWFTMCLIVAVGGTTVLVSFVPLDTIPFVRGSSSSSSSTDLKGEEGKMQDIVVTKVWEDWDNNRELRELIKEKLQPKEVQLGIVNETNPITLMPPKQIAHLHHMKTGGTSFDTYLHCGVRRMELMNKQHAIRGSLNECGYNRFKSCMNGDSNCRNSIERSFVMSFCAPLYSVNYFDWMNSSIVTVLRDPVDRVWSMFRFQTRRCYKCSNLLDIYKMIDNNTINEFVCPDKGGEPCDGVCISQLINHQSRNLLTSFLDDETERMDGTEKLNEAIENLKTKFTVIGITEELANFTKIVAHAFPYLAEEVEGSPKQCQLEHRNSSPRNNRCGADNTHWDLPAHPDEETRKAIIAHNQIDIALYEAAKKYFSIQKEIYHTFMDEEKEQT